MAESTEAKLTALRSRIAAHKALADAALSEIDAQLNAKIDLINAHLDAYEGVNPPAVIASTPLPSA